MGKQCQQCRKGYAGFGNICGQCRKGDGRGAVRQCVECSSYYSGFGDVCEECLSDRDQSFPSLGVRDQSFPCAHEFSDFSRMSGVSVDVLLKARKTRELITSAKPELSSDGSGEVELTLSSSEELELSVSRSSTLDLPLGASAELMLPISSRSKTQPNRKVDPFTASSEVPELSSAGILRKASVSSAAASDVDTAAPSDDAVTTVSTATSAFEAWEGTSAFFAGDLQYSMPQTRSWHLGSDAHSKLSNKSGLSKYAPLPGQVYYHSSRATDFSDFHMPSNANHMSSLAVGRREGSFRKIASERSAQTTDMLQAYAMLF